LNRKILQALSQQLSFLCFRHTHILRPIIFAWKLCTSVLWFSRVSCRIQIMERIIMWFVSSQKDQHASLISLINWIPCLELVRWI